MDILKITNVENLSKDETFSRFFFYGIENKEDVKEAIIYYSSQEVYKKHENENWYELSNDKLMQEIIEKSVQRYKQFYRFVVMNDSFSKKFEYDVNLEQIKQDIIQKVNTLLNTKIEEIHKDKDGNYFSIMRDKIAITKAGIFFSTREVELKDFNGNYYYEYEQSPNNEGDGIKNYDSEYYTRKHPNGLNGEVKWTRQIYDILVNLEKIESADVLKYYEIWIYTKLKRAILRDNPNEMAYMEKSLEMFEERKQKILEQGKNRGIEI